jgi:hypothetical protein
MAASDCLSRTSAYFRRRPSLVDAAAPGCQRHTLTSSCSRRSSVLVDAATNEARSPGRREAQFAAPYNSTVGLVVGGECHDQAKLSEERNSSQQHLFIRQLADGPDVCIPFHQGGSDVPG